MRVITEITDMEITVGSLKVDQNILVMKNAEKDNLHTTVFFSAEDVRRLFKSILHPKILLHAFKCMFFNPDWKHSKFDRKNEHPTPNPW